MREITPLSVVRFIDFAVFASALVDLVVEWGHLTSTIEGALIGLVFSYGYRQIIAGTIGTLVHGPDYGREVKKMKKAAKFSPNVQAFAYGLRMFSHNVLWPSFGAVIMHTIR